MKKLLSIIVPSYNMEAYLPKCLGSLLIDDKGLFEKLEVIVVNDGSKDRTSEIAHEFERKYQGVFCVIDKPNGHYGSCINEGLKKATAEFIRILDADDCFDTAEFQMFLKALDRLDGCSGKVDLVISPYVRVDNSRSVIASWDCPLTPYVPLPFSDIIPFAEQMSLPAITYRLDVLRQTGYRQTEGICYTDTEWWYSPMTKVRDVYILPHPVYRYLIGRTDQSVARASTLKNIWMYRKVLGKMIDFYPNCEADVLHKKYLYLCLARLAGMIYGAIIAYLPIGRVLGEFDEVDDMVGKIAELHDYCAGLKVSRFLRLHYVARLRRHGFSRVTYLAFLKCYLFCISVFKRIRA